MLGLVNQSDNPVQDKIRLKEMELREREFALKDLEILSLPFNLWNEATCNKFLCGNALCGYDVDGGSGDVSINDESGRTSSGEVIITIDGDVLT